MVTYKLFVSVWLCVCHSRCVSLCLSACMPACVFVTLMPWTVIFFTTSALAARLGIFGSECSLSAKSVEGR